MLLPVDALHARALRVGVRADGSSEDDDAMPIEAVGSADNLMLIGENFTIYT